MKKNKRIDLGEYIIDIKYNSSNGSLEVIVLDELGGIIESIDITNSDENDNFNINLN